MNALTNVSTSQTKTFRDRMSGIFSHIYNTKMELSHDPVNEVLWLICNDRKILVPGRYMRAIDLLNSIKIACKGAIKGLN